MFNKTGTYQMVKSFNNSDYNVGNHQVTLDMANEYYEFMEGRRRYLSFKDTITMGQLEQLRLLYKFKTDCTDVYDDLENCQPLEKKWKQDQVFRPFPVYKPVTVVKAVKKPRTTKWERTRRHGVLQLKIRELK